MILTWYVKHIIVNILHSLIEQESQIHITSTYNESDVVSAAFSLTPFTVFPYKCMNKSSFLSHIKIKT